MDYRTIEISWTPSSGQQWRVFTAARLEAASVWSWLVEAHADARASNFAWPTKAEWQVLAKGRFPNLNAQSVQQTIGEFCEAVASTQGLRRNGHPEAKYPFHKPRYRNVIFTNQSAKIKNGVLTLPCGQAGKLHIRIPDTITLPGRLMEVRLHFGRVELVCQVATVARQAGPVIGVDLGVNTLIAATDGEKAILISGRAAKAVVQLRNKKLAEIQFQQSKKQKGSRRHKRLQRQKYRMLDKSLHQSRDICHKATRKVADAFPDAKAYVGEPFNDAAQKMGRRQAQQVSQAYNAKIIAMLGYKLAAVIQVNEAYSSQTCPVCGERNKCRRLYRCRKCGCKAPRDVIGGTNIKSIGQHGSMVPGRDVPNVIQWVYPIKYPGRKPGSPPGARHVAHGKP